MSDPKFIPRFEKRVPKTVEAAVESIPVQPELSRTEARFERSEALKERLDALDMSEPVVESGTSLEAQSVMSSQEPTMLEREIGELENFYGYVKQLASESEDLALANNQRNIRFNSLAENFATLASALQSAHEQFTGGATEARAIQRALEAKTPLGDAFGIEQKAESAQKLVAHIESLREEIADTFSKEQNARYNLGEDSDQQCEDLQNKFTAIISPLQESLLSALRQLSGMANGSFSTSNLEQLT